MRSQGVVAEAPAGGPADHLCWVYDDADSFVAAAGRFLAGGLARGERLLYVGLDDDIERLRRSPGPLGGVEELEARGTLVMLPLTRAYDADGGFAPERQLAFYDAATRGAVSEGARGLRVVAELTSLAADPGRRSELVRWEHLADGFMAGGAGMSALCAYRRGALGADVLTEVATAHPQLHVPAGTDAEDVAAFRVYVDGGAIAVAGSVDAFGADRLRRALAASVVDGPGAVALDLGRLTFVDAAGCRAIAQWADERLRRGRPVRLVGVSRLVERVWHLLGYDRIVPVAAHRRTA